MQISEITPLVINDARFQAIWKLKADVSKLPVRLSQLLNDAGFAIGTIPTLTSQLTNDSGFITSAGSGSNILTATAGENISGGKAVMIKSDSKAYVYDINDDTHYGKGAGIAKTAATTGNPVDIYMFGSAYESGSGWTAGSLYYVSSTGILTTTPPSSGIVKLIAEGIGADTVKINNVFEVISPVIS